MSENHIESTPIKYMIHDKEEGLYHRIIAKGKSKKLALIAVYDK